MLQTCVAPFSIYQCVSAWAIWFPTRAFRPLKSAKKKLATACYPHTEHTALAVDSRSLCSVCVRRRPCRLPATALSGGSQLHSTIKDLRFSHFCPLPSPPAWGELQLMQVETKTETEAKKSFLVSPLLLLLLRFLWAYVLFLLIPFCCFTQSLA